MKIAFYIAENGTWLDKAVAWWTRPNFFKFWESGRYSHCEIVFPDGCCLSASPREGEVRKKWIDIYDGKWEIIQLDSSYNDELISIFCQRELGKPYDYIGIFFTFIFPIDFQEKEEWFCSELAAKLVFKLSHANRYHPNSLYNYICINNNK